jgi:hypothetical protein
VRGRTRDPQVALTAYAQEVLDHLVGDVLQDLRPRLVVVMMEVDVDDEDVLDTALVHRVRDPREHLAVVEVPPGQRIEWCLVSQCSTSPT